ncbi:hypothetical protein [Streptomyces sp. NPDC059651]|uniref:hypothetical protein n=1 Tax=Streptomyces sp. NPDC059651 TaxID=3346897 RepID=UPI0036A1E3D0
MHRIEARQIYPTCRGGATSHYPEHVVVSSYVSGARTVEVTGHDGQGEGIGYIIPASYFHAAAVTAAGTRRVTGYYLTGTLDY